MCVCVRACMCVRGGGGGRGAVMGVEPCISNNDHLPHFFAIFITSRPVLWTPLAIGGWRLCLLTINYCAASRAGIGVLYYTRTNTRFPVYTRTRLVECAAAN